MPNKNPSKPYQILAHTDDVLVIQTHAGTQLTADKLATNQQQKLNNSFGQFNLGLHVNDDPAQALRHRAQLLGFINDYLAEAGSSSTADAIYWLNQIHSNQVLRIDNPQDQPNHKLSLTAPAADALVTATANQALAIMTADCVPIVVYDPNTNQVAAIHAGWQGLANGVIFETYHELNKLTDKSEPDKPIKPVKAWMGACISQSCYEVSNEVVDKLMLGCDQFGMQVSAIREQIVGRHTDPNKAWLDIAKLAQLQLEQLGIELVQPSQATKTAPAFACSYADNHYYSYRRKTHLAESNTGRMALLIVKLT